MPTFYPDGTTEWCGRPVHRHHIDQARLTRGRAGYLGGQYDAATAADVLRDVLPSVEDVRVGRPIVLRMIDHLTDAAGIPRLNGPATIFVQGCQYPATVRNISQARIRPWVDVARDECSRVEGTDNYILNRDPLAPWERLRFSRRIREGRREQQTTPRWHTPEGHEVIFGVRLAEFPDLYAARGRGPFKQVPAAGAGGSSVDIDT